LTLLARNNFESIFALEQKHKDEPIILEELKMEYTTLGNAYDVAIKVDIPRLFAT
jgi:hypothetical protein